MGQLIHVVTEIFKNGRWRQIPEVPESIDKSGYREYGLLAGVRDSFNQQLFKVKGLPEDMETPYSDFQSQREFFTRLYHESSRSKLVFRDANGKITYGEPYTLETEVVISKEMFEQIRNNNPNPKRFYNTSMSITGGSSEYVYAVHDASVVGATFEEIPNNVLYATLEEYLQAHHADNWNEIMQDYGYFRTDFTDECMDSISYLTLEELLNADYTKYNSVCYKLDKEFYNKLLEQIGTLPACFTVSESGIGSLIDAMHEACEPTVTVSWLKPEKEIENLDMHKGIRELEEIRDKYGVSNEHIRIVFGFT